MATEVDFNGRRRRRPRRPQQETDPWAPADRGQPLGDARRLEQAAGLLYRGGIGSWPDGETLKVLRGTLRRIADDLYQKAYAEWEHEEPPF